MEAGLLSRRHWLLALLAAAGAAPARAQHAAEPWPADRPLPPLVATDLAGRQWDLAALRGQPVLINFWATWCPPCKEEMPTLQTLHELESGRLTVLAVNVREGPRRVRRYLQSAGLTLPVLPDPEGEITRAWDMTVFPTTVLIDASGRPRQLVRGAVDWAGPQALDWIEALRS
ncbi:MAG TPA: TlpA disulfide reductase family protein [Ottowia sp.]|uniref:TlpA family protein disulfide reductase n=1 Tax=Ottowia sp. TaxID=1898956 RepID=UPI002B7BC9A9|nr:TlpA disulfide reductase family protein [Ottowia sp.]HMN22680.1 TlpA disulfide reductase family protein [Ottowia sp.]